MKRKQKMNELLAGLCVTFDREFQPVIVDVWDKALADLSIEEIDRAVSKWVAVAGKKFPVPAEIRELIQGDPASNSSTALATIHRAMQDGGSYRSVRFTDEALMCTVDHFGGWVGICQKYREMRPHDVSYFEHDFKQVYQQNAKSGKAFSYRYFPGLFEIHNAPNAASFKRGRLLEPEVDVYGADHKLERIPLAAIAPKAAIVGLAQKQLESADESWTAVEQESVLGKEPF